jgi:hypothetical protein
VKYKRIDAAIHNLAHSFLSFNNYVDDEFVLDELHDRLQSYTEVRINFSTGTVEPAAAASPRIVKSLQYWRVSMADHLRREQVEPERIRDVVLCLRVRRGGLGFAHSVQATDDRGELHHVPVEPAS